MKELSKSEIISLLNQEESGFVLGTHGPDFCVKGVSTDSRTVAVGNLFIPLAGENFDGHDFIDTAFVSGAGAALSHREYNGDKPVIRVRDTMSALQRLAGAYRRLFSPVMAAVTGSAGKTTTKEMTAAVLSSKFRTLKTKGNLNNLIGLPLTLLELDSSHGAAVVEMGMSAFGEISKLSKLARPDIAIITNIGVSHIEFLGSREGIRRAKLEILDGMKKNGYVVLNGDDPYLKNCPEAEKFRTLYFAIDSDADVRALNIESGSGGSRFIISYPGGQVGAETAIAGKHNIYNALAAFAAGLCAGVPAELAAQAIKTVVPEGMRQRVFKSGNITIIMDCYNANPDSVKAALAVLNGYSQGKSRCLAICSSSATIRARPTAKSVELRRNARI